MFIFGWGGSRPKDFGPAVPATCPNCGNEAVFHYVSTASHFSLFFIPLIPYNRKHLLLCPICTRGISLTSQQAERAKALTFSGAALGPGSTEASKSEFAREAEAFLELMQPVEVTADWHLDPWKRHEKRYFDGAKWTEHVADRGVQSLDPPPEG